MPASAAVPTGRMSPIRRWSARRSGSSPPGPADGGGSAALARRLGVSSRTLDRRFTAAVGASPLQLARSRRVQTARALIAQSSMPLVDVAFAAGFGSLRQFNETMRQELGVAPGFRAAPRAPGRDRPATATTAASARRAGEGAGGPDGWLTLRLARRDPFAAAPLLSLPGGAGHPRRRVRDRRRATPARSAPPAASAVVRLTPGAGHVLLRVRLDDLADLEDVVLRCRRLLDLELGPGRRRRRPRP